MAAYRYTNGLVDHLTIVSQAAADRFVGERIVPEGCSRSSPTAWTRNRSGTCRAVRGSLRRPLGLPRASCGSQWAVSRSRRTIRTCFEGCEGSRVHAGRGSADRRPGIAPGRDRGARSRVGAHGSVRLVGVRDDVPTDEAADGYVMSSAWEGMPIVLLEAAAAGLPIVATRWAGIMRSSWTRGRASWCRRAIDARGQSMLRLIRRPRPNGTRWESGREHVRLHYGLARVVDRWEEVYREVWARKGIAVTVAPSRGEPRADTDKPAENSA